MGQMAKGSSRRGARLFPDLLYRAQLPANDHAWEGHKGGLADTQGSSQGQLSGGVPTTVPPNFPLSLTPGQTGTMIYGPIFSSTGVFPQNNQAH